jgi:ABC-type transport system involved in multi-copper enzyme maturation permease subunit
VTDAEVCTMVVTEAPRARGSFWRQVAVAARLDLAELRRGRWLVFAALTYLFLGGVFVLVGARESSLFGFTGIGRVVLAFCHALLLALPLLALTATGQAVGRGREDGSFELLFTQPLGRGAWFAGVSAVRLGALLAPFVVLVVAMGLYAQLILGQPPPWPFLWRTVAVMAALLTAFAGVGLAISTFVRHAGKQALALLAAWALGVALLDFAVVGLLLRWRLPAELVFALTAANPVEAARLALLAGLDAQLSTLGPVGFYLANKVGPDALFAFGVAWPTVVGVGAWLAALVSFRRRDLL